MPTIELKGTPETGFRLVERDFSGGVEVDYTHVAKITDDEAAALVEVGYLSKPFDWIDTSNSSLDPRSLLSVIQVDIGYQETSFVNRLIITLPANPILGREEMTVVDPWYESNRQLLDTQAWIQKIRFESTSDDSMMIEEKQPEPIEWPDNPAEAVAFW